uniref:Myb-like DNA-binding protein n=1 Tax=Globisporangium ultimum (strain ATCC 200006 / CBS 805.95 / DAOM BR144) TaxID=431595 RepID=K3WIN3_GLOUD
MVVDNSVKRGRDGFGYENNDVAAYEKPRDAQRVRAEADKAGTFSKRWTPEQDEALRQAVNDLGQRNWMAVAERVPGRDNAQCLQRWNKVLKPGLVKGPWSVDEDNLLMETMLKGYDSWRQVAAHIPGRTAKQCRERWRNRLDPNINKAPFTDEEDNIIQQAYEKLGNRWTQIAELLPGRTEDSVKLRWKTLNPNQRTYTKLGRPRLLPTDQIENAELGLTAASYLLNEPKSLGSPAVVPTPPSSTESNQRVEVKPEVASVAVNGLPEPIIDPLREESEEEMSSEDLHIFNAFLRGQSSGSMKLDGSFRNLLSDLNYDSSRNSGTFAAASSGSLQRTSSVSWAQLEGSVEGGKQQHPQALRKKLVSMMSLGSARSLSLRSLTEVDPDDRFLDDALNRQLSGMSLLGDDAGDGAADATSDNQAESATNSATLGSKMDSFEDAQLIADVMLNPVDMTKPPSFSEQLNGAGYGSTQASASAEVDQALLNEFLYPGDEGALAANPNSTTVSVQDFYNGDVSLDLLSSADRFEI